MELVRLTKEFKASKILNGGSKNWLNSSDFDISGANIMKLFTPVIYKFS